MHAYKPTQLGIVIKKNSGVIVIPLVVDIRRGTGGHWWALVGTGGYWWALVGTGGHWWTLVGTGGHWWALVGTGKHWCVVLDEQLDENLQKFEDENSGIAAKMLARTRNGAAILE